MAESHVGGTEQLEFAKGAIDGDGPPVAQKEIEYAHHDKAKAQAQYGRGDHRDDNFPEDTLAFPPVFLAGDGPDDHTPAVVGRGEAGATEPSYQGVGGT